MEIMLGDNNVESDLPSDLTDSDEEGKGEKDGNETDGKFIIIFNKRSSI